MNGPEATERMLRGAAENRGTTLTTDDRARLTAIADDVHTGHATFEELNEAQGLLYRAGNTAEPLTRRSDLTDARRATSDALLSPNLTADDRRILTTVDGRLASGVRATDRASGGTVDPNAPIDPISLSPSEARDLNAALERGGHSERFASDGGHLARAHSSSTSGDASAFSDTEATSLARRTGVPTDTRPLGPDEHLPDLLRRDGGLAPGEAATIRIRARPERDGHTDSGWADHFITVGRDPEGRAYIYNPDPSRGDRTLTHGSDAEIRRALAEYDTRTAAAGDGSAPNFTIMNHHPE